MINTPFVKGYKTTKAPLELTKEALVNGYTNCLLILNRNDLNWELIQELKRMGWCEVETCFLIMGVKTRQNYNSA